MSHTTRAIVKVTAPLALMYVLARVLAPVLLHH